MGSGLEGEEGDGSGSLEAGPLAGGGRVELKGGLMAASEGSEAGNLPHPNLQQRKHIQAKIYPPQPHDTLFLVASVHSPCTMYPSNHCNLINWHMERELDPDSLHTPAEHSFPEGINRPPRLAPSSMPRFK